MNGSLIFSPYHKTSLIPYPCISVSDFCHFLQDGMAFPGGSVVKNLPAVQKMQKTQFRSLGKEDALEEGMTTHSSILAWKIPMGRGAWRATVHGIAKSRTRLSIYIR